MSPQTSPDLDSGSPSRIPLEYSPEWSTATGKVLGRAQALVACVESVVGAYGAGMPAPACAALTDAAQRLAHAIAERDALLRAASFALRLPEASEASVADLDGHVLATPGCDVPVFATGARPADAFRSLADKLGAGCPGTCSLRQSRPQRFCTDAPLSRALAAERLAVEAVEAAAAAIIGSRALAAERMEAAAAAIIGSSEPSAPLSGPAAVAAARCTCETECPDPDACTGRGCELDDAVREGAIARALTRGDFETLPDGRLVPIGTASTARLVASGRRMRGEDGMSMTAAPLCGREP